MKKQHKMVLGYVLGGLLVFVLGPSLIYLSSVLIDQVLKIQLIPDPFPRVMLSVLLIALGLIFGIWSVIVQNIIGKGGPLEIADIEISPKTKHLVVSGPYHYSRNPMLFGACVAYFGLAIFLDSLIAVSLVCLFAGFMLVFVVRMEEKRLRKDFGNQYEKYRKRTSLFIPWFPKRK